MLDITLFYAHKENMQNRFSEVFLTAGHGGTDSGACRSDGLCEKTTTVKIANACEKYLNTVQIKVTVLDRNNNFDLAAAIKEINKIVGHYDPKKTNNALAFEIHQDGNYPQLAKEKLNSQRGVYYYQDDEYSKSVANLFVDSFIENGSYNATAHNRDDFEGSWAKGHYLPWAGYRLGWIEHTNPFAMILECGYIAGDNTDSDLDYHGYCCAAAIAKLFGKTIPNPRKKIEEVKPTIEEKKEEVKPIVVVKDLVTGEEKTNAPKIEKKEDERKEKISMYEFLLGTFKNGTIEHFINTTVLSPLTFVILEQISKSETNNNMIIAAIVWGAGTIHALLKMYQATQIKVAKLNNQK